MLLKSTQQVQGIRFKPMFATKASYPACIVVGFICGFSFLMGFPKSNSLYHEKYIYDGFTDPEDSKWSVCAVGEHLIASGGSNRTLAFWDATTLSRRFVVHDVHAHAITAVTGSPDGSTVATASLDGTVRVWSMPHARPLWTFDEVRNRQPSAFYHGVLHRELWNLTNPYLAVQFACSGKMLVGGRGDGRLRLWDIQSGLLLVETPFVGNPVIIGHKIQGDFWVRSLSFNCECTKIASVSDDGRLRVWSFPALTLLRSVQCSALHLPVDSVHWSPTLNKIVTSSYESTISLWDGETLELLKKVHVIGTSLRTAIFSPGSNYIASSGSDGVLRIWTSNLTLLKARRVHAKWVMSAFYTEDGAKVASGSWDTTIKLHDTADLSMLADSATRRVG